MGSSFHTMHTVAVAFLLLSCHLAAAAPLRLSSAKDPQLETYGADPSNVGVSGLSSGGFMAVQFQVSFSSHVRGAAVFAGGPFWCAQDSVAIATTSCMKAPAAISSTYLRGIAKTTAKTGFADKVDNLKNHKVFLFSGTKDSVVNPGVMQKLLEFYGPMVPASQIETEFGLGSEHGLPTLNYGAPCDESRAPYLLNCGYDGAGKAIQTLHTGKLSRGDFSLDNLLEFDQTEFFHAISPKTAGMDDKGFVYVPSSCRSKGQGCGVHIALHGCRQSYSAVGYDFVKNAGYNEWAEASNLIVLYPQAIKSAVNPEGCWDWWGFSGPTYASNVGLANKAIKDMLDRVLS